MFTHTTQDFKELVSISISQNYFQILITVKGFFPREAKQHHKLEKMAGNRIFQEKEENLSLSLRNTLRKDNQRVASPCLFHLIQLNQGSDMPSCYLAQSISQKQGTGSKHCLKFLKLCYILEVTLACVHHKDPPLCSIDVGGRGNDSQKNYYKVDELADTIRCIYNLC